MEFLNKDIMKYAENHSQSEPKLLKELFRETHQKILQPRMISGHFQGRLLSFLSKLTQPNNILEIGTNLGVSGQYFLKGLDEKTKSIFITIDGVKKLCEMATDRFNHISDKRRFKVINGLYDEKLFQLKESSKDRLCIAN